MRSSEVKHHTKTLKSIDGWFSNDAALLFGWIDDIQKRNLVTGDLFEIGCHHGKSAQLLGHMALPATEQLAVCDLFGLQSDNVSKSGCGDLEVFLGNMRPVKELGISCKVFQKNSAELKPQEIGTNYRFFHIDGGHNPDEALADLRLAAACLGEKGVIALDDPFRTEWPGVTEALIRFLDEYDEFEAMLVGCNKILLTRKTASAIYQREFENQIMQRDSGFGFPWKIKSLPFHSSGINILYIPDYRQKKTLSNLLRKLYYSTPIPYRHSTATSHPVIRTEINGKRSAA